MRFLPSYVEKKYKKLLEFIANYFAERDIEASPKLNILIHRYVLEENLSPEVLIDMLDDMRAAYEAGLEKEEAELLAEAIPRWERMELPMLMTAFGEILEDEDKSFEEALQSILDEAEKQLE